MADEDDLYADLYNEDIVGNTSTGSAGLKKEETQGNGHGQGSNGAAPATKTSFIPPAPAASTAATSFIPPAPAASTGPKSAGSFIPPAPQQQQQQQQYQGQQRAGSSTIDTAPTTNTDDARRAAPGYATGGSSSSSSAYSAGDKPLLPHEMPDEGKLFVGGLNWDTTDAGLKQYFTQFGKVDHCLIMRDPNTGRSRGFAFLTFNDPKAVNSVMVKEHYLDGKMIDPKRAIPRQDNVRTAKCFVGGVPSTATAESFRAYFAQFGNVLDSTLMMDRETQKPRGYGFVTYDEDSTVERLLQMGNLAMDGKMIEVKRATPRNNNNDATRRQPGRTDGAGNTTTAMSGMGANSMGNDAFGMNANPMASMMMNNPMFANAMSNQQFDPNALAQLFQQQGGAGAFNPLMMQQMMMGGMGGWGGSSNPWMTMGGMGSMGGMGNMNFGGMSGPISLSPTLGQSQFRSTNSQQGSGTATSGAAGSMRAGSSDLDARNTRGGGSGSGSGGGGLPNRPSGLPSRPNDSMSPSARERGSTSSGRDYQRERSPERGSARGVGSNRW